MRQGTIELVILGFAFLGLQAWWISMTIKNGRTGEVDKWGQRSTSTKEEEIERAKRRLENLFRS